MFAKLPGVKMGGRMRDNLIKGVGTLLAIVAGLLAFTFWPEQGQVFERTPAEVRRTLVGLDLPPLVFGEEPKKVKVLTPSPNTIVWSISEDEDEMIRYVVTLAAEGARATRVVVDVTGSTKGRLGDVAARIARNRSIRNMYIIAMKEQIAAALEQRSFQTVKIMLPSVIAVLVTALSSRFGIGS